MIGVDAGDAGKVGELGRGSRLHPSIESLHRGDQLLFAVDSVAHHEHPLAIQAPKQAVAGKSFNVKVISYSDKGKSQPAAHVSLAGAGQGVVTNSHGVAHVVAGGAGTLKLGASATGFVRAAQVRVHVSG